MPKKISMKSKLLLSIWSWLIHVIEPIVRLRKPSLNPLRNEQLLSFLRKRKSETILFYCSSAGEFDQVIPLIRSMQERFQSEALVLFQSESGLRYARKIGIEIPFFHAPLDTFSAWQEVFAIGRWHSIYLVKYELWPCFITIGASYAPMYLLNAHFGKEGGFLNRIRVFWYSTLLRPIQGAFCLSQPPANLFPDHCSTYVVGDTKYDRALQRTAENKLLIEKFRTTLSANKRKIFVVGSCWEADFSLLISALKVAPSVIEDLLVLIVPHEPTDDRLNKWQTELNALMPGSCKRISLHGLTAPLNSSSDQFLLVEDFGVLAAIYGIAFCAMVGGGNHFRVHNVLEPVSYRLPVSFGPFYENSVEAIQLVNEGLASVLFSPEGLAGWLSDQKREQASDKLASFLESRAGAGQQIISHIAKLNHEQDLGQSNT